MTASTIFGAIALLSLALLVWQFIVAMRFPLHQRIPNPTYAPDISILKPLKGCDSETRVCLESWLTQQYRGRVQILFGVDSAADPVCVIVCELIHTHPHVDAELVICSKSLGPNAKVSTLVQLQQLAKYPVIAVSDADVHVPEDFLSQAVRPLPNENVGLITAFYRLAHGPKAGFGMFCESFTVNSDFWSQVLQARSLKPIDFALGAVMITTSSWLAKVGDFESLVDYLADDYQLGNRISRVGGTIALSQTVVDCRSAPITDVQVWQHQLRWARTIRVSRPVSYFFSILNDATIWAVAWQLSSAVLSVQISAAVSSVLVFRLATALLLERKMLGRTDFNTIVAILFTDMLRPVIWALSFVGNTVTWRGRKYRVLRGGKLVPI